jgi:hypothetical protein
VRPDGRRLAGLAAQLAEGRLSLHVADALPLGNAAAALERVAAGRAAGAIVLTAERR